MKISAILKENFDFLSLKKEMKISVLLKENFDSRSLKEKQKKNL